MNSSRLCEACPDGQYNRVASQTACEPCPARQECKNKGESAADCPPNMYSTLGDAECHSPAAGNYTADQETERECDAGYACPGGTAGRQLCVAGEHSNGT